MANFNNSLWYHLFVNGNDDKAFIGTNLFSDGNAGAVFYQPTNTTQDRQRWQMYAVDETYYVLRSKEGGPDAFLGTMYSEDETTPGKTRPHMIRGNLSDDSIYWQVKPWGDGTFFFTNKKNGSDWHLAKKAGSDILALDSNITSQPKGQMWNFEKIADIRTNKFKNVDVSVALCAML